MSYSIILFMNLFIIIIFFKYLNTQYLIIFLNYDF